MPSRAIVNKLEVSEIPSELKKLNNLEKHLIALRLPFMKIVNLSSGKISNKGRVALRHVFGPKNYDLRHTYSESALNSEWDSV
jgi:hypothetical protein